MTLLGLGFGLALLAAGVFLPSLGRTAPRVQAAFDGFAALLVSAVCLLILLPSAVAGAGAGAVLGAGLGVVVAVAAHRAEGSWRDGLPLVALAAHAALDGMALASAGPGVVSAAVVGVAAHQLPFGLALGRATQARGIGLGGRAALVAGMAAATLGGYALGGGGASSGLLDGLLGGVVAGALLHAAVAAHPVGRAAPAPPVTTEPPSFLDGLRLVSRTPSPAPLSSALRPPAGSGPSAPACGHDHGHHDHAHDVAGRGERRWSALGGLAGVAAAALLLAYTAPRSPPVAATLDALGRLVTESAPALLLGFVLAGLITSLVDPARARWLAAGGPASSALRGVLFGLPLPICSCGVLPMYRSLVHQGVPATGAMAFLVATPELGLDAVLLSIPLLGGPATLARVLGAFGLALAVGWWVGRSVPTQPARPLPDAPTERRLGARVRLGLAHGLGELVDHTLPWVIVGLVVAALAEPLFAGGALRALPGWGQVPLAALVGVPMYVCASGATPLAAVAVAQGLSPGAAVAFLLAGPATNVTTFGMLAALHGRRVAVRFGVLLWLAAVLVGWGTDALGVSRPSGAVGSGEVEGALPGVLAAGSLAVLAARSLVRQGARGVVAQILTPAPAPDLTAPSRPRSPPAPRPRAG